MSAPRPELWALADRLGILPSYRDTGGRERETLDVTRERLLRALGHEAADEASARRAREALAQADALRLVEPVLVYREWEHGLAHARRESARVARRVRLRALRSSSKDGTRARREGRLDSDATPEGALQLALPEPVPHGYHEVTLEVDAPGGVLRAAQRADPGAPHRLPAPRTLGSEGAFGILANLYSLRGSGFGHGHFGDLAALARWAGAHGADFVGVNPLHAILNDGLAFSPYSPSSRLYRNVLYLDPEAVPELERVRRGAPAARRAGAAARRDALRRAAAHRPRERCSRRCSRCCARFTRAFRARARRAAHARARLRRLLCAARGRRSTTSRPASG